MASVKLYLDKRRTKSDGTFPLKLKLFHQNKARYINYGLAFKPTHWNDEENMVSSSVKNSGRVKATIMKKLSGATVIIAENEDNINALSIDDLKDLIVENVFNKKKIKAADSKERVLFLFEYAEELIDRLKKAKKVGNAGTYGNCLSSLKTYLKDKDIPIEKIDHTFLVEYETDCLSKGMKVNGISVYLRTLRAIINKAIDEGHLSQDSYPFRKFKIKTEATEKRAISKEEMQRVLTVELPEETRIWHARNYFAFMFNCRGMNFIDVAYLKRENIQGNRLVYRRKKTGKLYNMKLTKKASELVQYYTKGKRLKSDDYLFPILPKETKGDEALERERFRNRRKYFNQDLKKIGEACELQTTLTSYVSRHTWASLAKFAGVAPAVIGESLGHSDLKTTETYLANFDTDILDDANELIVG